MPEFTIGNYLATRLEQIGIKHYFMVPGDYNLVLLDQPGGPRTVDHQPAGARLLDPPPELVRPHRPTQAALRGLGRASGSQRRPGQPDCPGGERQRQRTRARMAIRPDPRARRLALGRAQESVPRNRLAVAGVGRHASSHQAWQPAPCIPAGAVRDGEAAEPFPTAARRWPSRAQVMASTSTSRSAPGTNKRDTSTVVTVGGVPVKRAARTLP